MGGSRKERVTESRDAIGVIQRQGDRFNVLKRYGSSFQAFTVIWDG
jgi:hypothetical protein